MMVRVSVGQVGIYELISNFQTLYILFRFSSLWSQFLIDVFNVSKIIYSDIFWYFILYEIEI